MHNEINILILSCGTRNKIVQYFKKELGDKGIVIATDCSRLAPALYDADKYYIVPKMSDENYLGVILNICKENNVKAVLSLIDPELRILSEHKKDFLKIGTIPIVSELNVVDLCFDKYKMFGYLKNNGIQTVNSYIDKNKFYNDVELGLIQYPVFVKPVSGSASININKVKNKQELELLFEQYDNLMIQEYMHGREYGVDVYIDLISKDPAAIFIKEKLKMRAGETDKSVSINNKLLEGFIKDFVDIIEFNGIIDIDIFEVNNKYYISEVNPRFGGGYPHAYECGVNVPEMIINNLKGKKNSSSISPYDEGIFMMKYNEIKFVK